MEQVLCIPRNHLPETWVSQRSVVPLSYDDFIGTCGQSGFSFMDRPAVEQDPAFKQVIPYVVLQTPGRDRTAVYCRKGSEARLHDLWSLGIGGHINPSDLGRENTDFSGIVKKGMKRELDEELIARPVSDPIRFLGIISEETTAVGSVHLGAVFRLETQTPEAYTPGPELARFHWLNTADLDGLSMELWSELALELSRHI